MKDTRDLVIVGGGGTGREAIWIARECGSEWNLRGIIDRAGREGLGPDVCGVPVLGGHEECIYHLDAWYLVAVGSSRVRKRVIADLDSRGVTRYAVLAHPDVKRSEYVHIGEGSIIYPGCILTTQVSIGRHNLVHMAVTIGHDTTTGDFCTLLPQAAISGAVTLGEGVEIGTHATVIQCLAVAPGCMLAAGSTLTRSLEIPNRLAAGSPARAMKTLEDF